MFGLFKRKRSQQREKALEWYKGWESTHPEEVQRLQKQEQWVEQLQRNNTDLDSLTDEELEGLTTHFSEIGDRAMEILRERRRKQTTEDL